MPVALRLSAAAIVCLASAEQPPPIPGSGALAQPRSQKQAGFPASQTLAVTPADNPQTPEKVALGEKLFFDGRLSVDGTVACATCHDPGRAFEGVVNRSDDEDPASIIGSAV